MLGECPKHPSLSISDLVMQEGDRVMSYVKACTKHAPRSVVVVAIPPVSAYTALVRAAFKKTPWYHPGRVIGSAGFAEVILYLCTYSLRLFKFQNFSGKS